MYIIHNVKSSWTNVIKSYRWKTIFTVMGYELCTVYATEKNMLGGQLMSEVFL